MKAFSENPLRERVLIIEDEIDLCLLMKVYFTRKNYDVYIACTLSEGLLSIKNNVPHLVLIDPAIAASDKKVFDRILETNPNVQRIVCGNKEVYRNPQIQLQPIVVVKQNKHRSF